MAGLAVLAVGGFAAGLSRQIASASGPSPFPPPQEKSLQIEVANGVAPATPVAAPRHAPAPTADDTVESAQTPPAADASAVVADPPSPPPTEAAPPPEPRPDPPDDPPTV